MIKIHLPYTWVIKFGHIKFSLIKCYEALKLPKKEKCTAVQKKKKKKKKMERETFEEELTRS